MENGRIGGSDEVESSNLSRSTNLRAPVLSLQTDIIRQVLPWNGDVT